MASHGTVHAQVIDRERLGAGYAHLLSVVAQPEIAVSGVEIDSDSPDADTTLDVLHIPFYKEFVRDDSSLGWYLQASAGYAEYAEEFEEDLGVDQLLRLESEWTALNGIAEAGMLYAVNEAVSLMAGLSGGVARLENKAKFSGLAAGVPFPPDLEGNVFNWDTNAAIYRVHGAAHYDREHGSFRVKGVAHLTYSYVDSFSESGEFNGFADDSGAAIMQLDVSRRLNSATAKRQLFLIGHVGSTHFLGGNRDQLGFDQYFQLGASLGVDQYAAGILYLVGEDIEGVTIAFNYNY